MTNNTFIQSNNSIDNNSTKDYDYNYIVKDYEYFLYYKNKLDNIKYINIKLYKKLTDLLLFIYIENIDELFKNLIKLTN